MKHVMPIVITCSLLLVICSTRAQAQDQPSAATSVQYLKADTSSPLPFSDAVRVGNILYLSGTIGLDSTGKVVTGGIEAETKQIMENVRKVLERNGSSVDRLFKCTVMLADMKEWPAFNAVYRTYFPKNRLPARSAFGTTGLAFGARVEVEFWAVVK
jgi:2-iminobutanoate/2-iminopropanoate deaminase